VNNNMSNGMPPIAMFPAVGWPAAIEQMLQAQQTNIELLTQSVKNLLQGCNGLANLANDQRARIVQLEARLEALEDAADIVRVMTNLGSTDA
jgi:hypothetical protein